MVWLVLLQIFLIALNAIFAGTEIAVISVNETKLEKEVERGNKRAKWLLKMTQNSSGFLATIQVAITLSGFLGAAFASDSFAAVSLRRTEANRHWSERLCAEHDFRGSGHAGDLLFSIVFGEYGAETNSP